MSFWTPDNLRGVCAGAWLARPRRVGDHPPITGVSTDTRTLKPGQAFVALKGERLNGHGFLEAAVRGGSPLIIVDDSEAAATTLQHAGTHEFSLLRVQDTGKALLRLAAAYRKTLETTRVIAVGGSNGKTTTTRLIGAVLASGLRGTASAKSYNNAIGVPLTILSASPGDHYLVCEVGTNAPGEIAQLANVVEPDVAVITSIGREHLEGFGTLEAVAREEASLLSYVRPGGLAVLTADAPGEGGAILSEAARCVPNAVTFGTSAGADLRLSDVKHARSESGELGLSFTINGRVSCRLGMLGEHNAHNALAAYAVARRLGVEEARIVEALAAAKGPEMRLQQVVVELGGGAATIINDAYNANPDSMLASLRTFAAVAGLTRATEGTAGGVHRRVVILGDMLELGNASEASHREIGRFVAALAGPEGLRIDLAVLVGHQCLHAADELARAGWAEDRILLMSDLEGGQARAVATRLRAGDLVLLKGSRRMRLERIVEALKERAGTTRRGTGIGPGA